MKQGQLDYINGLKGIGAGIVYLCHFVFAFYYGMYSLETADFHLPGNAEFLIGSSPLNVLFSGNFAVRLFLVMSGYVLCLGYFKRKNRKKLLVSASKRYLRLLPPILICNVVICLMMYAGLFRNVTVSELTGSAWLAGFNRAEPNLRDAVSEALLGCFLNGENQYNGVLWTIKFLFLGALLVYGCAWVFGDRRGRYVVYAPLALMLLPTDYAGIFLGFVLCDVVHTQKKLMAWIRKQKLFLWIVFAAGVYLSSYPSAGIHLENTIYSILGVPRVVLYHLAGALLIVTGVVCLKPLQWFFGLLPFVKLGEISYSLYLVHFPIIATFGCGLFELLYKKMSYNEAAAVVFVLTTLLVLFVSWLFNKYIEPLGKRGEAFAEKLIRKN